MTEELHIPLEAFSKLREMALKIIFENKMELTPSNTIIVAKDIYDAMRDTTTYESMVHSLCDMIESLKTN